MYIYGHQQLRAQTSKGRHHQRGTKESRRNQDLCWSKFLAVGANVIGSPCVASKLGQVNQSVHRDQDE